MAGIEDLIGSFEFRTTQAYNVTPEQLAPFRLGRVQLARRLGRVAGTSSTDVEITATETDGRGNFVGTVHRERPPLLGALHLVEMGGEADGLPRGTMYSGTLTVSGEGDPAILRVDFIRQDPGGDTVRLPSA